MVTSAEILILGIFEDAAQRDFHLGLIEQCARTQGFTARVVPRLTDGCRFDFLAEHLQIAAHFRGVLVGVDGKKVKAEAKLSALEEGVRENGVSLLPEPLLWSVASPSVEEWMMADLTALPKVLGDLFGANRCRRVDRPGKANAEQTAKERLGEWIYRMLGQPLERRGLEYADKVGRETDPSRVGESRNPDLKELLALKLPEFLKECARR